MGAHAISIPIQITGLEKTNLEEMLQRVDDKAAEIQKALAEFSPEKIEARKAELQGRLQEMTEAKAALMTLKPHAESGVTKSEAKDSAAPLTTKTPTGRKPMTAAQRAKMSKATKERWAKRGVTAKPVGTPASKTTGKREMSAATKKKLSIAGKARWAKKNADGAKSAAPAMPPVSENTPEVNLLRA